MKRIILLITILIGQSAYCDPTQDEETIQFKGLEEMIATGDFQGLDAPSFQIDTGFFTKVEIDNEDFIDTVNKEFDCDCDPDYLSTDFSPEAIQISEYVESAFLAESVRRQIQTDQNIGHLEAGYYIGTAAGMACESNSIPLIQIKNKKVARVLCAVVAASVAGIGKEVYDSFYPDSHTVDINDALSTAAGGLVHLNIIDIKW